MIRCRLVTPFACVVVTCLAVLCLAGGCRQSQKSTNDAGLKKAVLPKPRTPYKGTQQMQSDVQTLLGQLDTADDRKRLEIQLRLIRYGEPALRPLIGALRSDSTRVRQAAAFSLGKINDPRALDPLAALLTDPQESVRFEAATAMLRMDDQRGVDTLLYGLDHEDPSVRARSILILEERTGERRGYQADGTPEDRAAAVARWRSWAAQRSRERAW